MMKQQRRFSAFAARHPRIGPLLWVGTIEYFILQAVVGLRYGSYSLRFNTISDLGNTACGAYGGRVVCSPWHSLMNISFILLGLLMAGGALLLATQIQKSAVSCTGFALLALAGFGSILVGLFPENTVSALHIAGATQPFLFGNLALLILGITLRVPAWLRIMAVAFAGGSLIALYCFLKKDYGTLGAGGVERIVAYPQTVWMIFYGTYLLARRQSPAS